MSKPRPVMTVRPRFVPHMAMIEALGATLVGTALLTMMGGTLLLILLALTGLTRFMPGWMPHYIMLTAGIVALPPLYYEAKRRAYDRTWYAFYEDYLEFQAFSWMINRQTGRVRYTDIADISQTASALQERENLKTIFLFVPAMGYRNPRGFSGVSLPDIAEGKGFGAKIQDLIERAQGGRMASGAATAPAEPVTPEQPAALHENG